MPSELKLPQGITPEEVRVNPMQVLKKIFNKHGKDQAIAFADSYEASIPERAPTTVAMSQHLMNMREYLQQGAPAPATKTQAPTADTATPTPSTSRSFGSST